MSILGTSGVGGYRVAAALSGTASQAAEEDQVQADRAGKKAQADEVQLSQRGLDDSAETDQTHGQVAERDADGRLPWQFRRRPGQPETSTDGGEATSESGLPGASAPGGLDTSA